MSGAEGGAVFDIADLTVEYSTRDGWLRSLDNVALRFARGKVTALIGESGCGKSTLVNAIMGVMPPNVRIGAGARIEYGGRNLLELPDEERRRFRWREASMVFQAAQNALNPTLRIETQLLDAIWDHPREETFRIMADPADPAGSAAGGVPGLRGAAAEAAARRKVGDLLETVRLDPSRTLRAYPHELSGGMRQRAVIAMALVLDPECVLLDEPTTALDMITQHFIFEILMEIQRSRSLSMIIITHDIALAAKLAHRMVVMYGGEVMEEAPVEALFALPAHPYTKGLLDAIPFIDGEIVRKTAIKGSPPDLIRKNPGCVFRERCSYAVERCAKERPAMEAVPGAPGRRAACFRKEALLP